MESERVTGEGLRSLPSVDQLLQNRMAAEMIAAYGRPLTLQAIRLALDEVRSDYSPGDTLPKLEVILQLARDRMAQWAAPSLTPVINATGVVLHTNLGRAPLAGSVMDALQAAGRSYCNLEYDLEKGSRGTRLVHAEKLLTLLTGAEAALVVNNNAAAVLLALTALARRRRVIISRTQLVEIGGGFRVPDVMSQSGARLVEVGATNRVHLSDYEEALQEPAALVLHAHHSNFRIVGFTSEPELSEMAAAAHRHGVLVMDDLGSGALLDTARFGLGHEPTVQESLDAGVDLVCFSGDKLLGGPQAGIILGRKDLLVRLKKHPLTRALRADKLCLAALSATLLLYLKDSAEGEIPIWQMIRATPEQLRARAAHWAEVLGVGDVIAGESTIGGGSLPGETLPTYLLCLKVRHPTRFLAQLRAMHPPLIARVQEDAVVFDPRTVLPEEEGAILVNLLNALNESGS
jgi:L-seryl-tRNA(Ser) seleniumtransferase